MKPDNIRCALTPLGNIEAALVVAGVTRRVVVDVQTGELLDFNVYRDSDLFRWLVRAAREHVRKPDRRECQ